MPIIPLLSLRYCVFDRKWGGLINNSNIWLAITSKWRYLVAGLLLVLAVIARLRFNGLIYNFDFGLYFPDGAHYTYRALTFIGHAPQEAAELTSNWYATHGVKQNAIDPSYLIPETNPVWHLVAPRFIYPLLSAPFVYAFGISGMLVVPVISLAIIVFIIVYFSETWKKGNLGLFVVVLLLSSSTVLRWMISNCTDALLTALFGLTFILLIKSKVSSRIYPVITLLILLTTFTRFSLTVWFAISVFIWFELKNRALSITTLVLSSISSIPLLYLQFTSSSSGEGSNSILQLPYGYAKVAIVEMGQLLLLDRPLAVLVLVAIFLACKNLKDPISILFFAFAFGVWSVGAMNPVAGVNFRYQLPVIVPLALVVISNLKEISRAPSGALGNQNP